MKILTDRFIFTKNQQRDMLREHRVCGYIDAYFPIAFHSKYINVILLPDIKLVFPTHCSGTSTSKMACDASTSI